MPLAAALLLAALLAIPASNTALAQAPPGESLTLVNEDEDFVERKKDGRFIARPIFDRKPASLYYGVRHPDSGDWLTAVYRVQGGEKERKDGWEYSFEYPFEDDQQEMNPEQAYTCWSCWPATRAAGSSTPSTPWSPSTSPAGCGTRFWEPWTPDAGPKPSPGGPSRESTGPCAAWWRRPAARTQPTAGRDRDAWPTSSPALPRS